MNHKEQPLVSVLMTSFNREKYIAEAIESVLASTYENLELIIVDDGSKDNTVGIASSYTDPRVKVFVNEKNLGDYPNRNKAALYASGKYLKYVDADDFIYPWGLEQLVLMMEQFPEAGWGLCSLSQDKARPFPFQLTPPEAYEYHFFGPGLFHKAPLSSIFRREIFAEVNGFAPLRMVGDYEMWFRLAQKYNVVLMPHGIVWSREHGDQEMKDHKKYISQYEAIKASNLKADACPLTAQARTKILKVNRNRLVKQIIKDMIKIDAGSLKIHWDCLKMYR